SAVKPSPPANVLSRSRVPLPAAPVYRRLGASGVSSSRLLKPRAMGTSDARPRVLRPQRASQLGDLFLARLAAAPPQHHYSDHEQQPRGRNAAACPTEPALARSQPGRTCEGGGLTCTNAWLAFRKRPRSSLDCRCAPRRFARGPLSRRVRT